MLTGGNVLHRSIESMKNEQHAFSHTCGYIYTHRYTSIAIDRDTDTFGSKWQQLEKCNSSNKHKLDLRTVIKI